MKKFSQFKIAIITPSDNSTQKSINFSDYVGSHDTATNCQGMCVRQGHRKQYGALQRAGLGPLDTSLVTECENI